MIVRPFLPEKNEDSSTCGFNTEAFDEITKIHHGINTTNDMSDDNIENVPDIAKPFLIIAIAHIVTGLAFIFLSNFRLNLEYELINSH